VTQQQPEDYTDRDYASLLGSLLDTAARKLPEWTDRSENDLGRVLLELFARVGDTILYYQDRIADEAFLASAVERRSVIDLLSLIGYTLATPAPARAVLALQASNDDPAPVRVEVGARFATEALPGSPPVEFAYLPADGTPLTVPRDGTGGTVIFKVPVLHATLVAGEAIGTSTGDANQAFRLAQVPVLLPRDPDPQEHLVVEVNPSGGFERWERRATLLYSRSGDRHFTVAVDADDAAEVLFGDGTYGQVPPPGSTIRASYLVGGGAAGNVGPRTITMAKAGVSVPVTVGNELAASGGADREPIEHARRLAPLVYRSLQRAVTATDFAALAESFEGVARAVAVAPAWNYVDCYVVAAGGEPPGDELHAALQRHLEERCTVTTIVSVRKPVFVRVDLGVEVGVEPVFYRPDVERRIRTALDDLFRIDALDFGQSLYLSKVYEAVEAVRGVAFARVTTFAGFRSDPDGEPVDPAAVAAGLLQLRPREFLRQGAVTLRLSGGLA
jgi:hypothetical protein